MPPTHAVAVTSDGYSLRFGLEAFVEASTRAGRRFARLGRALKSSACRSCRAARSLIAATRQARALLCKVDEVNFLSGPGRGVILIKLDKDEDRVLGFIASSGDRDLLTVETTRGAAQTISTGKYSLTSRGGRGREVLQRGEFTRVLPHHRSCPCYRIETTLDHTARRSAAKTFMKMSCVCVVAGVDHVRMCLIDPDSVFAFGTIGAANPNP